MASVIDGMKALNLSKALELYNLIGEYIPEELDEDVFTFTRKIVDSISNDAPGVYADTLCLMTDKSLEELNEFSTQFLLELFIGGLVKNNIFELREFCRKINYG